MIISSYYNLSPLRTANHIQEATTSFDANITDFDFLVSMKESEHAHVLCNPIEDDMSLKHFDSDFSNYHRHSYKDYTPNGAIFIGKPHAYLERKHFFGPKALAYVMNRYNSIDIDTEIDLMVATAILTKDRIL